MAIEIAAIEIAAAESTKPALRRVIGFLVGWAFWRSRSAAMGGEVRGD